MKPCGYPIRNVPELARRLYASLPPVEEGVSQQEIDAAWSEEIERRSDALHAGWANLATHDEVIAEARAQVTKLRLA